MFLKEPISALVVPGVIADQVAARVGWVYLPCYEASLKRVVSFVSFNSASYKYISTLTFSIQFHFVYVEIFQ